MNLEDYVKSGLVEPIRGAIARREFSIESLTAACMERIAAVDPAINAVIALNPEALALARRLDQGVADNPPPLYGVPVLVKDNVEIRELPTTAGSLALADNFTGRDAPIIETLRASGAVILGKTNLSEWANFRSSRSSSGWSGIGGQTRNPHDLARSPCGSSSGSGAAVAARLAPLAIGTETDGSVVCPAHTNGVVGIKPTVGLLPADFIVPISHSQDTAGPMALDVMGAAHLLSAMHGKIDFTIGIEQADLKGKRLGIVRSSVGYHEGVDAQFEMALNIMRDAGAEIVDELIMKPNYKAFRDDAYNILLYEFKHDLNAYLAGLPNALSSLDLAQLIEFNLDNSDTELRWFQQEIFLKSQAKGGLESPEYTNALARAGAMTREGIDGLLAEHRLDALVASSGGPAWTIDQVNGDHGLGGFSTWSAVSGYPHITVPMGQVHGLPVGVSFAGGKHQDAALIAVAAAYEKVRAYRPAMPAGIEH